MHTRLAAALAAGLMASAAPAFAAPPSPTDDDAFELAVMPGAARSQGSSWTPAFAQFAAGWRPLPHLVLELMGAWTVNPDLVHADTPGPERLDRAFVLRAMGELPMGRDVRLRAGLGLARTTRHPDGQPENATHASEAALSAGLGWRLGTHYTLGLEATRFARTQTTLVGVRNAWSF